MKARLKKCSNETVFDWKQETILILSISAEFGHFAVHPKIQPAKKSFSNSDRKEHPKLRNRHIASSDKAMTRSKPTKKPKIQPRVSRNILGGHYIKGRAYSLEKKADIACLLRTKGFLSHLRHWSENSI